MEKRKGSAVPALDKVIGICEFLSDAGNATFSQIQQALGLPKSSTHGLLGAMLHHGLLRQDKDNKYSLGLRFYEFGNRAIAQFDIRKEAMPFLYALSQETQLTCHLGVLQGVEAIYLAKLESSQPISIKSWEGKRLSLHSSSVGKALIAWCSGDEIDALFPNEALPVYTDTTLPTRTALKAQLEVIRQRGWAMDDGEDIPTLRCIAAPVHDAHGKVIAAISAVGAAFQIPDQRIEELAILVRAAAINLSTVMGFNAY
ncbi:IclR family transcriptional regulator [Uliginosibacterium sp. sgz301328]|uniref:IclR family transcriptional regulator n=1 Tax=Uliginosibacterium sp. sgz301328 TaxID=3243764 RepID=UPI00359E0972